MGKSKIKKEASIKDTSMFFKVGEIKDKRFYRKENIKNFWDNRDEVDKTMMIVIVILVIVLIARLIIY